MKTETVNGKKNRLAFVARFLAAFAPLFLLVEWVRLPALYETIAHLEATLLSATNLPATATGSIITTTAGAFEITAECTGLAMAAMLASLLFASRNEKQLKWLAAGTAFLLAFNLLRLYATLATGAAFGQGALEIVHPALWFVDAAAVVAVWAKAEGIYLKPH
ncbi:MAG: archaeosortase/exosortase family protein [Candidatus Micrarchaeota archaeon]